MAPSLVQPSVQANNNARRDAEALAEAVTRPTLRGGPTKDIAQHDIQALHRGRERLMGERTALVHAVHGLMNESHNVSYFVARHIWRRSGVSRRRVRAKRTHRGAPQPCLLVHMYPSFDLLHTARN